MNALQKMAAAKAAQDAAFDERVANGTTYDRIIVEQERKKLLKDDQYAVINNLQFYDAAWFPAAQALGRCNRGAHQYMRELYEEMWMPHTLELAVDEEREPVRHSWKQAIPKKIPNASKPSSLIANMLSRIE